MYLFTATTLVVILANVFQVEAHAIVTSIDVSSPASASGAPSVRSYPGYRSHMETDPNAPPFVGWATTKTDFTIGPVFLNNPIGIEYGSPDMACHNGSRPPAHEMDVNAGDSITPRWTPWAPPGPSWHATPHDPIGVNGHKGPVLFHIAACNGPCIGIQASDLDWITIYQRGVLDYHYISYDGENLGVFKGYWATDVLREQNSTWTITLPPNLASGHYVLRMELIALHGAGTPGQVQHYPQCFNLNYHSSGTDTITNGTKVATFYKYTDPGLCYSLYQDLPEYVIPGPLIDKRFAAIGNPKEDAPLKDSPTGPEYQCPAGKGPDRVATPVGTSKFRFRRHVVKSRRAPPPQ
ncbi:MAG: hypothetical protein Q9167_001109 [Letrouitia subvulpina]